MQSVILDLESERSEPYRPIATYTLYLQFGAAVLLVLQAAWQRVR